MTAKKNILILGSGGREHALAWKFAQSDGLENIFVAPGNPGMFLNSKIKAAVLDGVVVGTGDHRRIIEFCRSNRCAFVLVGPEGPLAAGVVDDLIAAGLAVFGPTKSAARLESSKSFARRVIQEAGVASPEFMIAKTWQDLPPLIDGWPWQKGMVIKADGLASGKGVFVCKTREEALRAVASLSLLDAAAGGVLTQNGLICEERLEGREVSAFALCDGRDFISFGMACDHKRLHDGDRGPNTGGMGAYSPVPWLQSLETRVSLLSVDAKIGETVFRPVLKIMDEIRSPFRGFLFAGLMITESGPKLLEFNVRLGDPETQVLLPRLDEDLFEVISAGVEGRILESFPKGLRWHAASALHVVKVAAGYPGIDGVRIRTGDPIVGETEQLIFYSGVAKSESAISDLATSEFGHGLETAGGRVLGVTAMADDLAAARGLAYSGISRVGFEGAQWRTDIGE